MKSTELITALAVLLGTMLVAISAVSMAAPPVKMPRAPSWDIKMYTGTSCEPVYPLMADDIWYGVWDADVTSSGFISCPIIRDDVAGTDGMEAEVGVYDGNGDDDVQCHLVSRDEWGNSLDWSTASTSGTPGNDVLELRVDESVAYGINTLHCWLPEPSGSVEWYRVYEHQDGYDDMTDYDN